MYYFVKSIIFNKNNRNYNIVEMLNPLLLFQDFNRIQKIVKLFC